MGLNALPASQAAARTDGDLSPTGTPVPYRHLQLVPETTPDLPTHAGVFVPLRFAPRPTSVYLRFGKRIVDIVGSIALLVLLAPLFLAVAIWIRLDSPGNPIYRQERIGRNGSSFTLYKFRTMTASSSNELVWFVDGDGTRNHKVRNDPRITRAGAWLRRSSLDELPQLWNVARGDMSLVGPRPELPEIVAGYDAWQHQRHDMRPGLTGWWQVSGRSDKPMHENTDLDIYYIEHASLRLDAAILWKTVSVVFGGMGAF